MHRVCSSSVLVGTLWLLGAACGRIGYQTAGNGGRPDGATPLDAQTVDATADARPAMSDAMSDATSDGGGVDGCVAAAESCNGVDDDCDGRVDEGADATCPANTLCSAGRCRAPGETVWARTFAGSLPFGDCLAASGSTVVLGGTQANGTDLGGGPRPAGGFFAAFRAEGGLLWERTVGGEVGAVDVDAAGRVAAAGTFRGTIDLGGGPRMQSPGAFVAQYAADGHHTWDATYGGAAVPQGVGVSASGVWAGGFFGGSVTFGGSARRTRGDYDLFAVRHGRMGAVEAERVVGSPALDRMQSAAALGEGRFVVVGGYCGSADFGAGVVRPGMCDGFVAAYAPDAGLDWLRTFGGAANDCAYDVAVDGAGNTLVLADFSGTVDFGGGPRTGSESLSARLVSYGPDGSYRWDRPLPDGAFTISIAVDPDGNTLVTGAFGGSFWADTVDFGGGPRTTSGGEEAFVAAYGPDGSYRWDRAFAGPGNDRGLGVAALRDAVFVAGRYGAGIDIGPVGDTGPGVYLARLAD